MLPIELNLCIDGYHEKRDRDKKNYATMASLIRSAFHAKARDFSTDISRFLGSKKLDDDTTTWGDERIEQEKQKLSDIEKWFEEVDKKIESGEWVLKSDTIQ